MHEPILRAARMRIAVAVLRFGAGDVRAHP